MRRSLGFVIVLAALTHSAFAALDIGEPAPDFSAPAALGGANFTYSLRTSLNRGPVVLYFFPAAFSEGCSIEAQQFAQASAKFEALGATIVGVSADDIETLGKFSVQACQSKFPVASDPAKAITKSYDAVMQTRPEYATRLSYVIAPNGSILYSYLSLNPSRHVENTLVAVREWAAKAKPR